MKAERLSFPLPVTLVGGGALTRAMLDEALALAPVPATMGIRPAT